MGWFDEQIRQRESIDNAEFNASFKEAANSVLGEQYSFSNDETSHPLLQIVKYFKLPPVEVPPEVKAQGPYEEYDYIYRNAELMARYVKPEPGWYKEATGVFMGRRKDTGNGVPIFPGPFRSYYYIDETTHKKKRIGRKNWDLFGDRMVCVYKSLPTTKLTTKDLIKFALESLTGFDILVMVMSLLLATLIGLLIPKLSYFLFNVVAVSNSISLLISTVIFFACASISSVLFTAFKTMAVSKAGIKLNLFVQSAIMERVISLPPKFFKQYSTGDITQRMDYLNSVCSALLEVTFSTFLTFFFSLAYFSQIITYAPGLATPAAVIILVSVLFSIISTSYQSRLTKKALAQSAKNSGVALDMINGIQKIKLAGAEKRMFARWAKGLSKETQILFNPPIFIKINTAVALFISLVGQFAIYRHALASGINVAEYYAFQTAYSMTFGAISTVVVAAAVIAEIKPRLDMAKPILDTVPEKSEEDQLVTKLKGEIELSHITFKYDDTSVNVLEDFSLKINPGEYIAIVGKTGCGKSTLVRLLLGFEIPNSGAIYYDGRNINDLDKKMLRKRIGAVLQNDKLFFGDIFSNISIAANNLDLHGAWEAAELAGVADDIKQMPMGMHTVITDGSSCISGGQRQRIIIARAIAPKPSILIFDEATSALDNITQKKISESLDSLDCTRIVIAHRLSTIKHCDRILFMEQGKIIEDGTYDELIKKDGAFAELVKRQQI